MKVNHIELEKIRGRLITLKGRNITWGELARLSGVSVNTICALKRQRSSGSIETIKKIVGAMRAQGLDVMENDLLTRA